MKYTLNIVTRLDEFNAPNSLYRAIWGSGNIVIPNKYTSIDEEMFWNKGIKSVVLPKRLKQIWGQTFQYNELTSVVIPEKVEYIRGAAFANNNLEKVVIPRNTKRLENGVFAYNNLTSVVISHGVKSIWSSVFAENNLTSVVIPGSVNKIEENAFRGNPLKKVFITSETFVKPFAFPENAQLIDTLIGTTEKDRLTGTPKDETLSGGRGRDILHGGAGADGYLFHDPGAFGKKEVDKIVGFSPEEGDSILVCRGAFDLGDGIKFKSFKSKKNVMKARKSNNEFLYDKENGFLYFNENGNDKGWGDGGLFAKLQGAPYLESSDFTIV